MTIFVVYSLPLKKPVYTTDRLDLAQQYVEQRLSHAWAFRRGRYSCPYVIYDCDVHTGDDEEHPEKLREPH